MKEITIVLSAYKREAYFKEQIQAIKKQKNVIVKDVLLWQNENHINVDWLRDYGVKFTKSDYNIRYHGRFTLPLLYDDTQYTVIFDDDTIPGEEWLMNAMRCVDEHNCIATQNGRIYNHKTQTTATLGDNGRLADDTKVDFGGHSWVFKTEIVRSLWQQKQFSYKTGEDMQFCMSAKFNLGVETYCVRQTNDRNTGQLRLDYGSDDDASWRNCDQKLRSQIYKFWLQKILDDSN